jgi:hypothetical protein
MSISDLCTTTGDDLPQPIPQWAAFLASIGAQTAKSASVCRSVAAVALPTRSYAAALVASGVTHFTAGIPVEGADLRAHFLRLCQAPLGTKVTYTDRNTRHRGVLDGIDHLYGDEFLRVQITSGDRATYLASIAQSKNIELFDWDGDLPRREAGRTVVRRHGFIDAILGDIDPTEFVAKSRLDAIILGRLSLLRQDIAETPLAVRISDDKYATGFFQDLIRAKSLSSINAFRTDIYGDSGSLADAPDLERRVIVIFDGARAFLKFKEKYRANSWIVLLDRTGAAFQDAVEALNQEYMKAQRIDFQIDTYKSGAIFGVELMTYIEAPP